MKEVKCEHCSSWTDGHQELCQHCGKRLNEKHLNEEELRRQTPITGIPFIKIHKDDPFFLNAMKYIILFFQLIFASIISIVAAMASSTVH